MLPQGSLALVFYSILIKRIQCKNILLHLMMYWHIKKNATYQLSLGITRILSTS